MDSGKSGYFDSSLVAPYIEIKTSVSPAHKKSKATKISRKGERGPIPCKVALWKALSLLMNDFSCVESSRKSKSKADAKKLNIAMIGLPQNDLRHTGHIGYDGAVFGDVSFIGDNYDKLPVKVGNPCEFESFPHGDELLVTL